MNPKFEAYSNAPIVLAIFQIRLQPDESFSGEEIKSIGQKLVKDFPLISENHLQKITVDPKSQTKVSLDSKLNGIQFASEKKDKHVFFEADKFSYEIQNEYSGWEQTINEFMSLWKVFEKITSSKTIRGISVRFVNRFNLPVKTEKISEYFNCYIHSQSFDAEMFEFQFKYTSSFTEGIIAHISHSLEAPISNQIPYYFDIDAINLNPVQNSSDEIKLVFENLRLIKNTIFEQTLTEAAKNLIR
jgi:uncharacterized protein (TIGR04255 family)